MKNLTKITVMDTINERLAKVIEAIGYTVLNDLDRALDVSRNTTAHYVGMKKSKPGPEFLEKLFLKFPQIDTRWVMTGQGSMFAPERTRFDYVESLEQKIEALERSNRRYETMIDMAAQRQEHRIAANFQQLSKVAPNRVIVNLVSRGVYQNVG